MQTTSVSDAEIQGWTKQYTSCGEPQVGERRIRIIAQQGEDALSSIKARVIRGWESWHRTVQGN